MGLPDHDRARGAQSSNDFRIDDLRRTERIGAPGRDLSGDIRIVFDRDGDAEQREVATCGAVRVGRGGRRERAVGEHDTERVDAWIDALDSRQCRFDQFVRAHLAVANESRLLDGTRVEELVDIHDRTLWDGVRGSVTGDRGCRDWISMPRESLIGGGRSRDTRPRPRSPR